jgi:DNA repair protein RadC
MVAKLDTLQVPVYYCALVRAEPTPAHRDLRIVDPREIYDLLSPVCDVADREIFFVLMMDVQGNLIGVNVVTVGGISEALVNAREVFKPAILCNAHSVALAHNHPSGDSTPSPEDRVVTATLSAAGDLLGIPVLDHVVIGVGRYSSARYEGWL